MITVGLFNIDHRLIYIDDKLVIALINNSPTIVSRNGIIAKEHLSYVLNLTKLKLKKGGKWRKDQEGKNFHTLEERKEKNDQPNARSTCSTRP